MDFSISLQEFTELFRSIVPPKGLAYVGAGSGSSMGPYLNGAFQVGIVAEADVTDYEKLLKVVNDHQGWIVHNALVSDRASEAIFYQASNPNESGLLSPEGLAKFWRNLKIKGEVSQNTTTLEALCKQSNLNHDDLNWLVLECIPALPIIKGMGAFLEGIDVIIARVIRDASVFPGLGASKFELDNYLIEKGYRRICLVEERQPAMANVLYLRDQKDYLLDKIELLTESYRVKIDQINLEQYVKLEEIQSKDKYLVELQQQNELLIHERNEQLTQLANYESQVEQFKKECLNNEVLVEQFKNAQWVELGKNAEAFQVKIDQINLEQHVKFKELSQLHQAELTRINRALDEKSDAVVRLKQELEEQQRQTLHWLHTNETLQKQINEQQYRQELLDKELVKAEVQIDFIKDILIREKAF